MIPERTIFQTAKLVSQGGGEKFEKNLGKGAGKSKVKKIQKQEEGFENNRPGKCLCFSTTGHNPGGGERYWPKESKKTNKEKGDPGRGREA